MKSGDGAGSISIAPSTTNVFATVGIVDSTTKKRPSVGEGASLRKHLRKAAFEPPTNTSGSTTRAPVEKGKGVVELEEAPRARGALHPILAKQVYECSSEELMKRADKSTVANKELKLRAYQELVTTVEHRAKELEEEAKNLDKARSDRARLEGDVPSLTETTTFLEAELKGEGPKAMATHKASQRFELGLKKMGRVGYEFGYWVALEWLRGKHLEIAIEN
ncbi:hypothetical protein BHM03_00056471 [Ensete ventricosum]|nr:hypothetical protein BHM03_00056471 [Ensete ventricosum]